MQLESFDAKDWIEKLKNAAQEKKPKNTDTKLKKNKKFADSYEVGIPPFCNADASFCAPGFVFVNKNTDGCITGCKGTCKFDLDAYKNTATYKEMVIKKGKQFADANVPSNFYEFGTAPFCEGTFCDAILANKIPISTVKGACWTGNKVIAIDPVADYQFDKINKFEGKCLESRDTNTKMWTEFWRSIAETSKTVGQLV